MLNSQMAKILVTHLSDDPVADYAIRLPNKFFNRCIEDIFPQIESELGGTLIDEELGITVTWQLSEPPVLVSPYYLPEMECNLSITVEAVNKTATSISVYLNGILYFIETIDGYVLKIEDAPYMNLTPEDPFAQAVLKNKMSEVASVLNKVLAVVLIPKHVPDFFPEMPPLGIWSFPFDTPEATGSVLRTAYCPDRFSAQKLTDIVPRVKRQLEPEETVRTAYDDVFRVQISHRVLEKVIREKFWDPMPKEFTEEGGLIRLLNFNLEMKDDYLALVVELGGRVRVDISGLPDPEWSVDFLAPLDVHLKVYVAADKTIRISYDETYFPSFNLVGNNSWADMYESMIPGLKNMIASEIGTALVSNVIALVGDIDELLFELSDETFDIGDKSVLVAPQITDIRSYGTQGAYYLNFAGVMNTSVNAR